MANKESKKYKLKNWGSISKSLFTFLVISLLLFSITLGLLLSAKKIANYYFNHTSITLYIDKETSSLEKNLLINRLKDSKDIKFAEIDGDKSLIDIYLNVEQNEDKSKAISIIERLEKEPRVIAIHVPKVYEKITTQDTYFLYKIAGVIFTISTIIILTLLFFIIRNKLIEQKETLRNMQLIGATNSYIQEPILFRNFWCALLAGAATAGIMCLSYFYTIENNLNLAKHISLNRLYMITSITIFFGIISVAIITKLVLWCILRNKQNN